MNGVLVPCVALGGGLGGAGIGLARADGRAVSRARAFALVGLIASALGLALKALPWFSQDNWLVLAFVLPLWIGTALSTHSGARARASCLPARLARSTDAKS